MNSVLVITGPTAAGKTKAAFEIANKLGSEIISCDSMQVYRHMDIGTAKPPPEILAKVRHHLIDISDPNEEFNVYRFRDLALAAIDDVISRGKIPVVTGGTGLYLNSVIYGLDFPSTDSDPKLRHDLEQIAENQGREALFEMLKSLDPASAERIHPNNIKRVIRAIEIASSNDRRRYTGAFDTGQVQKYDFSLYALRIKKDDLYEAINNRVDQMIGQGLVSEVETLVKRGILTSGTALQAIGYKEVISYLEGETTLAEAISRIKKNTRNYAKRQMTWFRKMDDIKWVDADGAAAEDVCGIILKDFFEYIGRYR